MKWFMLADFEELIRKNKSSSLWAQSVLKSTLILINKVNMENYSTKCEHY